MGQAAGARTLFVWQPVSTYHYDMRHHVLGYRYDEWLHIRAGDNGAEQLYRRMSERREEPGVAANLLYLADMQLGRQENLYVDWVHYTAAFSGEIAGAIAEDLGRRGWLPCAAQAAG
jgi:hypothetical protein